MIDLTKPVQTRDGRKVRILCTDMKHPSFHVVGLVTHSTGVESTQTWQSNGWVHSDDKDHKFALDLVNVPQRHKYADIIIAWANGAEIETRSSKDCRWEVTKNPQWYVLYEYRVKSV